MALSDSDREKHITRPVRAVDTGSNHRWSDKQKLEAISTWLVLGNLKMTSNITGIPEITLRVWKTTGWWAEVVADLKGQEKVELSNRLKKIVEAAHSVVENRLLNGDAVLKQDGTFAYKPVNMRDAHRVAVDLQNQRDIVEKAVSGAQGPAVEGNDEKLQKLAEKFATFATLSITKKLDKQRTVEVTDVIEVAPSGGLPEQILPDDEGTIPTVVQGQEEENPSMGRG